MAAEINWCTGAKAGNAPCTSFHSTQEAEHIARRKEVWEAMQAARRAEQVQGEIQVGKVFPPEIGYGKPPEQEEGFAASTAKATGKSKAATNRATRRATEVCQAARA